MEDPTLELDALPDTQVLTLVHNLLSRLDSNLRIARDRLSRIQRALNTLLWSLEHPRRKPPIESLLPAEVFTRKDKLHSPALANRPCQPLTASSTRNHSKLNLRLSEVRFDTAVQHIRHHGQLAAAAQRVAVDGADDGLLDQRGEFRPALDEVCSVGVCEGFGRHFFDVGAGCEGLFAAGQDHGADAGVGVEGFEGGVELVDQRGEEGVEGFGAVDLDYEYVVRCDCRGTRDCCC